MAIQNMEVTNNADIAINFLVVNETTGAKEYDAPIPPDKRTPTKIPLSDDFTYTLRASAIGIAAADRLGIQASAKVTLSIAQKKISITVT